MRTYEWVQQKYSGWTPRNMWRSAQSFHHAVIREYIAAVAPYLIIRSLEEVLRHCHPQLNTYRHQSWANNWIYILFLLALASYENMTKYLKDVSKYSIVPLAREDR